MRHVPCPYAPMEITCKTVQGRFLLRPGRELNELILGVIGRALTLYDVRLYLLVVASNHMHMILAPADACASRRRCWYTW